MYELLEVVAAYPFAENPQRIVEQRIGLECKNTEILVVEFGPDVHLNKKTSQRKTVIVLNQNAFTRARYGC